MARQTVAQWFPFGEKVEEKKKEGGVRVEGEGDVAAAKTQLQRDDKGWEKARSKEEDLRIKMKLVEDWRWLDRYRDSQYTEGGKEEVTS